MHLSQSPQLIEVDPQRIKFNPANPRKHRGTELLRLENNLEKVGMVQFPTVRAVAGGFFECIDGEGRVLFAQHRHLKTMWVVCFGVLHDTEALTMLQSANAVRSFGFLDECQGLANLHRQGFTTAVLAEKFGEQQSMIINMVAIGYIPDELLTIIRDDILQSEEHGKLWTKYLLFQLLKLRQQLPGRNPHQQDEQGQSILENIYDYEEVRLAIEKVLEGKITTGIAMHVYVTQRHLELFQARFDQEVQTQLERELAQAKQTLKENHSQEVQRVQQETARCYEGQVQRLQQELDDLNKSYKIVVTKTAKQSELVEHLQVELQLRVQKTERERKRLEELQLQVQAEARTKERQLQEDGDRKLEAEKKQLQGRMDQEYARTKADLSSHYAQKERELELHTEKNMHQIVANCTRLLVETQISVLHLISPEMFKGVVWLQHPEIMGLLAQIRTVRETLEKAEEQLLHGNVVFEPEERRSYNGSKAYH